MRRQTAEGVSTFAKEKKVKYQHPVNPSVTSHIQSPFLKFSKSIQEFSRFIKATKNGNPAFITKHYEL